MPNSSKDQILITVTGLLNSGKTLVYDLIKKEDGFINLDISKYHYHLYKKEMINQIGEENVLRIEPFIESEEIIYSKEIFVREIGFLMRKFSDHNFVIKPVDDVIPIAHYKKDKEWVSYLKKYMPIKEENIHCLLVVRHPKISWVTSFGISFDDFFKMWTFNLKDRMRYMQLVKIEEIEKNEFLKKIIRKTDLSKVRVFTEFDFNKTKGKNFDNIDEEMLRIEESSIHNYRLMNYDLEDENANLFMKERMNFYSRIGE